MYTMLTRTFVAAIIVAGLSHTEIVAQEAPSSDYRQGFWIGFGLGPAYGQIDCARCGPLLPDDPWAGGPGISFYLAVGGTPRPNLLVGAELNSYVKRNDELGRDATLGNAGVVFQYYPQSTGRLYLKGGAGSGGSLMAGGNGLIESTGWGLQLGGGYDVLTGSRFALAPFGNIVILRSEGDQGQNRGEPAFGPRNPRYLQLGVGFHWY
jgi:hypothetical protein